MGCAISNLTEEQFLARTEADPLPTLDEMVAVFRRELGCEGPSIADVVRQARREAASERAQRHRVQV